MRPPRPRDFAAKRADGDLPPAVICPLASPTPMGLDIARRLAAEGVPVYAVDHDKGDPGRYSNACRFVYCPYSEETEEREYIAFLIEFGKTLGTKAVLYGLTDRHILLFSQYRDELQEYFTYVMTPDETLQKLTTKDGLGEIAERYSIAGPRTYWLTDTSDIRAVAGEVPYPAILKPVESTYWGAPDVDRLLRSGVLEAPAKVVLCHNADELVAAFERIAVYDPRMVVQEVIPGEDSRLVYAAFYVDRHSRPLGYLSGRKRRVIPVGFGSASFVETFSDPDLQALVFRILSDVGYQGLGGLEFKQDPRDGVYKLIEFNTRFGMWDGLGVCCGVDLPWISYRDTLGMPVGPQLEFRTGMKWVDWQRDIRAFLGYRKQGLLTFAEWRRSLKGPVRLAVYSASDWKPSVMYTLSLLRKLGVRLVAPLTSRAQRG
jgi:predicted ATP-grasp superfamily ATP-dependent carboligase